MKKLIAYLLVTASLFILNLTAHELSTQDVLLSTFNSLNSVEEIQRLLEIQSLKLKEFRNSAKDVLYFSGGLPEDKTGYCKHFWSELHTGKNFGIPEPALFAGSQADKQLLFNKLFSYAQSNLHLYMSHSGKFTPEKYTDVEGASWSLGVNEKKRVKSLEELPKEFDRKWQKSKYSHGLFEDGNFGDFFNKDNSKNLLYLTPYPISGYYRPLVLTLVKDQCNKCTDFSLRLRVIGIDGLPKPDLSFNEYFSQSAHINLKNMAELRVNNKLTTPQTPLLLIKGLGTFGKEFVFWTLREQKKTDASAREIDGGLGYYTPQDTDMYFRHYVIDITSLNDPGRDGPHQVCSIQFN